MEALAELWELYNIDISKEELDAISLPNLAVKIREGNHAHVRGGSGRHKIPVSLVQKLVDLKNIDPRSLEDAPRENFLSLLEAMQSEEITSDHFEKV